MLFLTWHESDMSLFDIIDTKTKLDTYKCHKLAMYLSR